MATVHREPNQVKWIGVRPGHNGDEVLININVAVNTLLYTVPADKILFIFSWQLSFINNTGGGGYLYLRDNLGAEYYVLAYVNGNAGSAGGTLANNTFVPIEVVAGYDIYLTTSALMRGGVQGILIDT